MTARLSHLNDKGEARMVDVSAKEVTSRMARAEGFVAMAPATLDLILAGKAPKGDVLATARIAGIMAAKRTHELIPLCHRAAALRGDRRVRAVARSAGPSRRGDGEGRCQDRGRDGGADRGLDRLPHHLRHVQGGRPGDVLLRHPLGGKDRRPLRPLSSADGSAFRRRSSGPRDERALSRSKPSAWRSTRQAAACSPRILPRVSPSRPSMPRPWTAMRCAPPTWPPSPRRSS